MIHRILEVLELLISWLILNNIMKEAGGNSDMSIREFCTSLLAEMRRDKEIFVSEMVEIKAGWKSELDNAKREIVQLKGQVATLQKHRDK